MKHLLLDYAFKFVESVIFLVGIDNLRSQKALEKIGADREGRRANSLGRDSYVYRLRSR
jgi:RimJ/RimL family protein N-acetyltransferase